MEFRKMRRFRQALTRKECAAILREEKRGTLRGVKHGGGGAGPPVLRWML